MSDFLGKLLGFVVCMQLAQYDLDTASKSRIMLEQR